MQYEVQIVADEDLPPGTNLRQIAELEDGSAVLFLSGVYADCWRYMRAWEAMHEPSSTPLVLVPAHPLLYAV